MSQNYPKYYLVTDLEQLEQIRSWVMIRAHRSMLLEQSSNGDSQWVVVVNDAQGMPDVTPLFEAEFSGSFEPFKLPE